VTRAEKVAFISEHEIAMEWLRVCYKDPDAYNCGRCEKCIRTMIGLRAADALERCRTLPDDLDLAAVATLDLSGKVPRAFAQQNLRALGHLGTEAELTRALAGALATSSETGEGRTGNPEGEYLRRQLSLARRRLERTRARLEASGTTIERLRARNEKLAQRNARLATRYSGWQVRLMEVLSKVSHPVSRMARILSRISGSSD
jgi:hypothetical protein